MPAKPPGALAHSHCKDGHDNCDVTSHPGATDKSDWRTRRVVPLVPFELLHHRKFTWTEAGSGAEKQLPTTQAVYSETLRIPLSSHFSDTHALGLGVRQQQTSCSLEVEHFLGSFKTSLFQSSQQTSGGISGITIVLSSVFAGRNWNCNSDLIKSFGIIFGGVGINFACTTSVGDPGGH